MDTLVAAATTVIISKCSFWRVLKQLTGPTSAASFLNFNGDEKGLGFLMSAIKGHNRKDVIMTLRKVQRDCIFDDPCKVSKRRESEMWGF